jgi:hypothetical protein
MMPIRDIDVKANLRLIAVRDTSQNCKNIKTFAPLTFQLELNAKNARNKTTQSIAKIITSHENIIFGYIELLNMMVNISRSQSTNLLI